MDTRVYDNRIKKLCEKIEFSTDVPEVLQASQAAAALEQARVWKELLGVVGDGKRLLGAFQETLAEINEAIRAARRNA